MPINYWLSLLYIIVTTLNQHGPDKDASSIAAPQVPASATVRPANPSSTSVRPVNLLMRGLCGIKKQAVHEVNEDGAFRGISRRYFRNRSSKWLGASSTRAVVDNIDGKAICPSLMELCAYKICEHIDQYGTFSMLPRDISQQIVNELVYFQCLDGTNLEAFRGCTLQDIDLCEYPGVDDSWMDVISSQGSSLLSANLSGSDVTDCGLVHFKDCDNIEALNFNYCDQISDSGLGHIRVIPFSEEQDFTATNDAKMFVWSMKTGRLLDVLSGHEGPVHNGKDLTALSDSLWWQWAMTPCIKHMLIWFLFPRSVNYNYCAFSPVANALCGAWARLCKCLGQDFLPYMTVVVPPLLQSAQLKSDVIINHIFRFG
ncbi:F-box/LRR-repeat protein 14-like protein isoform X1 [Tanacetum coccineum]